jgi:hypothetical protein
MSDSLISRAMRQIAMRRMEKLSPEKRQQIARKGGNALWEKLSAEERREAIERIQKARKDKRAQKAKAEESKTAPEPPAKSRKRTLV